jgi:hypothetical protein
MGTPTMKAPAMAMPNSHNHGGSMLNAGTALRNGSSTEMIPMPTTAPIARLIQVRQANPRILTLRRNTTRKPAATANIKIKMFMGDSLSKRDSYLTYGGHYEHEDGPDHDDDDHEDE